MRKSFALVLILTCMVVSLAVAQPGGGPPPDPGQPLPITGIEILLGIGCLLGIKRLRDSRNKNSSNP
jgi:hypothetical protein